MLKSGVTEHDENTNKRLNSALYLEYFPSFQDLVF